MEKTLLTLILTLLFFRWEVNPFFNCFSSDEEGPVQSSPAAQVEKVPSFQDEEEGNHLTSPEEYERLVEVVNNANKRKNPDDEDYNPEDDIDGDVEDNMDAGDCDEMEDSDGDYKDEEDLNKNKPKRPVKNYPGKDRRANYRSGTGMGDQLVKAFLRSR